MYCSWQFAAIGNCKQTDNSSVVFEGKVIWKLSGGPCEDTN